MCCFKPSLFSNCFLCGNLHLFYLAIQQHEISLMIFIVAFSIHVINPNKKKTLPPKKIACSNFFRRQGSNLRDFLIADFPMMVHPLPDCVIPITPSPLKKYIKISVIFQVINILYCILCAFCLMKYVCNIAKNPR